MSPVFGHGQLRLYLLALLEQAPRHGYEVIRALEQRFEGMYSPSAGTVYPRLARLEEEGLVVREDEGRKAVYRITVAGRAEIAERRADVHALEVELTRSLRRMAEDVRAQVSGSAGDVPLRDPVLLRRKNISAPAVTEVQIALDQARAAIEQAVTSARPS